MSRALDEYNDYLSYRELCKRKKVWALGFSQGWYHHFKELIDE